MQKQALRLKYKELRSEMDPGQIDALSLDIANKALRLDIWNKTYFHIFLPISGKKEVNTEFLLHILFGKDKSVVVPKSDFDNHSLKHILLQENTELKATKFGIPEPVNGIELPPESMEVVFIPLLAYDTNGNRVGYGKGFYDRFLKDCREDAIFIGLSLFQPEAKIECDSTDIRLHYCVTPEKIHQF